ncbi:dynamin family protein [filamentous cyanobacterium CCP3]|nr:dynamin family protein [filamentous cyanobacterium CCP3]
MLAEHSCHKELAELLTQITGYDVHERHITHRLLFSTTLATLLIGVMYADGQVTESEKQQVKSIIGKFIPPQSQIGKLIKPIFLGVQQRKSYANTEIIRRLTSDLTNSERLLIIFLCCEVATIDGEIAEKEEIYIKAIANIFKIDNRYLSYFLASSNNTVLDDEVLSEIYSLLDPHHFQNLDPAFMHAADLLRAKLPPQTEIRGSGIERRIAYEQLGDFQRTKRKLARITSNLFELLSQSAEQDVLPTMLRDEAAHLIKKVKSQCFRIAVVGEFSQGKSTLLNALLGEEIQPVRAIPCSGTVTVLRHGERHRVICRYKDGREEEVPLEKYQELASISQEAALSNIAEELSKSLVQEIVFEHPGLELCRHQVEIVDSPGLNEHPERTAITHQLLQNTDAVIFLANASRPFTQGERELLKSLQQQLQSGSSDQPVENLFVLVNFMDLLRHDTDKQQVKQLANNFLQSDSPIISGPNRLHFISAQAALDAMLEGSDNEYLQSFQDFAKAIQFFLAEERGCLTIRQATDGLERLIQEARVGLKQTLDILEGQISLSESEQSQIIEQMGAASGREVKLRLLRDDLVDEALEAIGEAWEEWLEGVEDRIADKSADWTSEAEEKEKILQDFANQFLNDLSADLNDWLEKTVKDKILLPKIKEFDKEISDNLNAIYENLRSIDLISGSNLSEQFNLSLSHFGVDVSFDSNLDPDSIKDDDGLFGFLKAWGGSGLVVGGMAFLGFGFIPLLLASLATGAVMGWLFGSNPEEIVLKMKQEVYTKGFDKFSNSLEQLGEKIGEGAVKAIDSRYDRAIKAVQYSISILNGILTKHESVYREAVSSHSVKKEFIQLKTAELTYIESNFKALFLMTDK